MSAKGEPLLLRPQGASTPGWAERLEPSPACRAPAWLDGPEAAAAVRAAPCVLIDMPPPQALHAAQRVHALDDAVQTLIVAPSEQRARLERLLLFAPGLGELWLVDAAGVEAALLARAAEVTRQRRRYRRTRARLQAAGAERGPEERRGRPRTGISDAYLAQLLQVLPDPVLSLDEDDLILSWNPAAERALGHPAREAVGSRAAERLHAEDPAALRRLLAAGRCEPSHAELRLRARDGAWRTLEVTVLPVRAAEQAVRSVVLHDVTREREIQAELEMQTARLQEQTAELETVNEELQQAISSRSRFYAAMSHELRTPINAVLGYNELLLDGLFGPLAEEQATHLAKAQRAARHLLELVNDVLDLAKVEAGRVELDPGPTRFPVLLAELLETVQPAAAEQDVELRLLGPDAEHEIRTDPRRVRQILLNLLSNAIKFGAGHPVEARWRALDDGGVEITVRDRGGGIAPTDLERIFEEFVQVQNTDGSSPAIGTGLGLAVSRRLAELLGGSLSASSEVGEGSEFVLRLPRACGANWE